MASAAFAVPGHFPYDRDKDGELNRNDQHQTNKKLAITKKK